ncbi:cysteine hydrolase [Pseudomonas sp. KSR10]|jgi:nicotinamidase-related amidase|uniref:cysteine hydrolase family protein n=1 Tax=unclassified Pseudomonas TaxID=196821 RepID=UPI001EF9859E|nr:cysteine hydrolase family protein [Pseudomonas sp. KSR10]MCG6542168.1 cysteine hydrolase [Pseudomonas sp. KSR10]
MEDAALLVIDQQKGIDHPKLGQRNNPHAEAVMLALLVHWQEHGRPVIHIRHRSSDPDSVFWPHQDGFEFKPAFQPGENETVIEKSTPCAFTRTDLEALLAQLGVSSIVITGVATNNSVEATARTAGCKGIDAYVVEDACFTFAKRDYRGQMRSAEAVHDMSLANLDGEYAKVVSSAKILSHRANTIKDGAP